MTINCKGQLIDLTTPKVMGILNITPDSFYDGGRFNSDKVILNQVEKMLRDGATFIDVGGQSTKPNADVVSEADELARVLPVIQQIIKEFPDSLFSIDTFRSKIAQECVEAGAAMINDISAGTLDNEMMKTVAQLQVPYIMMHLKGNPKTMQSLATYQDIVKEMLLYFSQKVAQARQYIQRLATLERIAVAMNQPFFYMDAESIKHDSDKCLGSLSDWLQLDTKLSPTYEMQRNTSKERFGDTSTRIGAGRITDDLSRYADFELDVELLKHATDMHDRVRNTLILKSTHNCVFEL